MSIIARALAVASFCAFAAPAGAGLTVTALDHSGFMLSDGKTKILIDALLQPSQWPYHAPSPDLLGRIEQGGTPFDGVALLLISHDHEDHYSPVSTVRFLAAHPETVLVTTPEVARRLNTIAGADRIAARIVAPELAWKQALTTEVNGVSLELDRIRHGDNGKWACENDAFVFTLGGRKILFATATSGVFPEEYVELGYAKRGFDLAFFNYNMAVTGAKGETPARLNDTGLTQLKTLIGAKTTVLMHMEGKRQGEVESLMPDLEKKLPGVTLFKAEMESRSF